MWYCLEAVYSQCQHGCVHNQMELLLPAAVGQNSMAMLGKDLTMQKVKLFSRCFLSSLMAILPQMDARRAVMVQHTTSIRSSPSCRIGGGKEVRLVRFIYLTVGHTKLPQTNSSLPSQTPSTILMWFPLKCFTRSPSSMQPASSPRPGWCSIGKQPWNRSKLLFQESLKCTTSLLLLNGGYVAMANTLHCANIHQLGEQHRRYIKQDVPHYEIPAFLQQTQDPTVAASARISDTQQKKKRQCTYPGCDGLGHVDPARKRHLS